MPTLKYLDRSFECATAIKGTDYIHLLDESGVLTATFDQITDFTDYTLENGEYTDPTEEGYCRVAVVRDDGTIGAGTHTCADIGTAKETAEEAAARTQNIYTKEEVLSDASRALWNLPEEAKPTDAFTLLANYNLHWWERTIGGSSSWTIKPTTTITNMPVSGVVRVDIDVNLAYYTGLSISSDGTITPTGQVTKSCNWQPGTSWFNSFRGNYVNYNGGYYRIADDATFIEDKSREDGKNYYQYFASSATLYAPVYESSGTKAYACSTDRNAYPDNGTQDGDQYFYIGIPFERFLHPFRLQEGQYSGTGTYGQANPITLSFNFVPSILIISKKTGDANIYSDRGDLAIFPNIGSTYNKTVGYGCYKFEDKTFTMYGTVNSAEDAMNVSGEIYYYRAIGYGG